MAGVSHDLQKTLDATGTGSQEPCRSQALAEEASVPPWHPWGEPEHTQSDHRHPQAPNRSNCCTSVASVLSSVLSSAAQASAPMRPMRPQLPQCRWLLRLHSPQPGTLDLLSARLEERTPRPGGVRRVREQATDRPVEAARCLGRRHPQQVAARAADAKAPEEPEEWGMPAAAASVGTAPTARMLALAATRLAKPAVVRSSEAL
mmetsp:Transcript_58930/g.138107  ORF Transcript_58930/g.138107 Transcript_58930/m.138107 type:complete len:204 (+) Transcript_58930:567-1178(+)